ncbi:MAG: glycosyltransferase family 1 protein [Candidatus Moraniibacteriota bacterium]
MARICIDVRCLMEGRRTGVEEYTQELLLHIFEIDHTNEYVLFFNSWKKPAFDFGMFEKYSNVTVKKIRLPNKLLNFSFWYFSWPKIDKLVGGADVVFLPNIIFGAVSAQVKMLATIHDLSFERYPEYFSWKRRFWHIFINSKKLCERADRIISVSQSSWRDVVNFYGLEEQKAVWIHSAVAANFRFIDRNDENLIRVKEKYNLPFKFILYLGTIEPRKNISGLVRAYSQLQEFAQKSNNLELLKYKLVIAGSNGWLDGEIFREIANSKFKEKIILPGFISNEDKVYVYNLATLFVYPSFFEGFGFPPLEAMQCGVPVITSNNSSLPEICAEAGMLIDPDQPGEIARAMEQILENRALREKLIAVGLERAKQFSWEKTAKKTLKLLAN